MIRHIFFLVLAACAASACDSDPSPVVQSVTVTAGGAGSFTFANRNQTTQLLATAALTDGSSSDVTAVAAWVSSNNAVTTVSPTGLLTAVGNGTATITATHEGQAGTFGATVSMNATADVSPEFARLCSPFRAQMAVTMRETSNNISYTVTLLEITFTDFNGVQRFHTALTAADIIARIGTNVVAPGGSQTVTVESAYPGNVDTADSTGRVILTGVDAAGLPINITINNIFQRDRC